MDEKPASRSFCIDCPKKVDCLGLFAEEGHVCIIDEIAIAALSVWYSGDLDRYLDVFDFGETPLIIRTQVAERYGDFIYSLSLKLDAVVGQHVKELLTKLAEEGDGT